MPATMKKIEKEMALCMAVTLSLFLSFTGTLISYIQSGKFQAISLLLGFVVSTIISLIVGLVVPMGKIHRHLEDKHGPGFFVHLMESLYSDLIYTPLMTTLMVLMAYFMARSHGEAPPFLGMWLPSLGICLVVGYILVFIFQPFYMKTLLKKHGLGPGRLGQPPQDD